MNGDYRFEIGGLPRPEASDLKLTVYGADHAEWQ
jgi:hypothetical protein